MLYKKITEGAMIQTFNDAGECIEQEFFCGDQVEYETEDGEPINVQDMPLAGREYQPFDVVQPNCLLLKACKAAICVLSKGHYRPYDYHPNHIDLLKKAIAQNE